MRLRLSHILFTIAGAVIVLAGCRGNDSRPETRDTIRIESPGDIPGEGGRFTVSCAAESGTYTELHPSCGASWIKDLEWSADELSFSVEINTTGLDREADIRVSGKGCEDGRIRIHQLKADFELFIDIEVLEGEDYSVTASFTPSDDSLTYCTGIMTTDEIGEYADGAAFVEALLADFEEQAAEEGIYLTTLLKRNIVSGPYERTFDKLQPGVSYSMYAVSMDIMGNSENVLFSREYTAPASLYPDATYGLEVTGSTTTSITFNVKPSEPDIPYYLGIISAIEYDELYGDDSRLAMGMIAETQFLIDYYNGMGLDFSFSDFTKTGPLTGMVMSGLIPDTEYCIYAFGLNGDGILLTPVSRISQRTGQVVITDDCSFELTFDDVHPTDFDITISPSNSQTRYYVQIAASGILESYTPEEIAAMFINMANQNGMDWAGSSQIYTGRRTFDTYDDLNYAPFEADTEYSIFVFGVSTEGERTTEVAYGTQRTGMPESSDLTVDVNVSDIGPSLAHISCIPSDDDQFYYTYVADYATFSSFGDEEDFVSYIVSQAQAEGIFEIVKGAYEYDVAGYFLRPDTEYIAFAFGYTGGVTTKLFYEKFRTEVRVFSDASLSITYTVMDGDEIYRQNPATNYAFQGQAAVIFNIAPKGTASSWFFSGFSNSVDYMQALDPEELLYSIQSNGRFNYNKTEVMYAVPWNSTICGAGYAMDSDGREGEPVLIEAVVPSSL